MAARLAFERAGPLWEVWMAGGDPRDWMWGEALGALARAERMHREMFRLVTSGAARPSWEPPVDVLETNDQVVVIAALPGVPEAALSLAIDDCCLIIQGERTLPTTLRTAVIHRLELPQGRFERRVALPPGRYDNIRSETKDGCLVVTLRKLA
jgi:HSP20 family molecular chaperone IbpA